jgi:hypothetical protein
MTIATNAICATNGANRFSSHFAKADPMTNITTSLRVITWAMALGLIISTARAQDPVPPKPVPPAVNPESALAVPATPAEPAIVSADSAFETRLESVELPQLLKDLESEMANRPTLSGIRIVDAKIERRVLAPGMDVELFAEGGTVAERVEFHQLVRDLMQRNASWQTWLQKHDFAIRFAAPPVDSDILTQVPPTADELVDIKLLLDLVLDQIELDPRTSGAYVEPATYANPLVGPGRVLVIHGRLIEESQRAILLTHFDDAFAALDSWRARRGEVYVSLDEMVVGPLDADRARRYTAIGHEALWSCDLFEAQQAFARAIADDPSSTVLRYWGIVLHVALGQEDRAKSKLGMLLAENPLGSRSPLVARALERLQGPLRWRLTVLEEQVLLSLLP